MSTGRTTVLDAAIELLGTEGIRGLTHRAVDAQAGLPTGATSNYFRTKDALYVGIVERFSARETARWEELALRARPLTPAGLGRTLGDFARDSVGTHRSLTLARYALLVEGALRPDLQSVLAETGARVNAWFAQWLHAAGSTDAQRDTQV